MDSGDVRLANQVRNIQEALRDAGWVVVNALGEQATPDRVLWFTSTYTHGEYTVEASHREKGYGRAMGTVRVRITPTLLEHHPDLGQVLAAELINKQEELRTSGKSILDIAWPPDNWRELAR